MSALARLLAEIHNRDRLLSSVGRLHLLLAAVFAAAALVDARTILGIDPWVKPFKFAVSISIYLFTTAWLLGHVRHRVPRASAVVSRGVALAMFVEIVCIAEQSLRGVPSHFNQATPLDAAVFGVMGFMILVNTLLAALLLALFLASDAGLPRPYLWGVRLGLLLLLAGSVEGAGMIVHGAHTVGAPDGGPGLALVNWSTQAGDLRPAHAVALHGLQVLPLFGWWMARTRRPWGEAGRTTAVFAFAAGYALLSIAVLALALSGRPLLLV